MRTNLRHRLLLVLIIGISLAAPAQDSASYSAPVKAVMKPGFYKITLNPEIVGRATREMNDLRILDKDNKQVPYLLRTDPPVFTENNFLELKVLSTKKEEDKLTHVIIQNLPGKEISELFLVVKNNDATRTVIVSGSDDESQWYVIKENIRLTRILSGASDRFVQSLEFPKSNYRFFKIIINGKDLLPVNIVKAGIYEDVLKSGKYVQNPAPTVIQKDSGRVSYIKIHFSRPYRTDQIEFDISGPKYYQRTLSVFETERSERGYQKDFLIRSGQPASFDSYFKSADLEVVIQNDDNPPLKINSVKSLQLNKYLLAYLDSAGVYKLTFGDTKLQAPTYDIAYFQDTLKNASAVIETGEITQIIPGTAPKAASGILSTVIMWIIIAAVLALLLFLTMRMTKEVNNKKNSAS